MNTIDSGWCCFSYCLNFTRVSYRPISNCNLKRMKMFYKKWVSQISNNFNTIKQFKSRKSKRIFIWTKIYKFTFFYKHYFLWELYESWFGYKGLECQTPSSSSLWIMYLVLKDLFVDNLLVMYSLLFAILPLWLLS